MRARKGSGASGSELPKRVLGDRDPGAQGSRDPSATPPATEPAADNAKLKPERRNWWQEFCTEFLGAHPEKQIAQVYYISAILAVIASLTAGLWAFGERFWPEKSALGPSPELTVETQPVPAATLSIVVLPFLNLSGDPAQDYFADGITDSLTTDLSRALPGSFVVARATAFTFKGKGIDAREIGRELHVHYALEGSALRDGRSDSDQRAAGRRADGK